MNCEINPGAIKKAGYPGAAAAGRLCNQVAEALSAAIAPIRSLDLTQTGKRPSSICC